jgi:hypothetical protein
MSRTFETARGDQVIGESRPWFSKLVILDTLASWEATFQSAGDAVSRENSTQRIQDMAIW